MNHEIVARQIDDQLSHVWMVRTFLKHSEEAEEDDELNEVHRELYDYALALGPPFRAQEWEQYQKMARKKLKKLVKATAMLTEIQPEISSHTNFQMSVQSLNLAVARIRELLGDPPKPEVIG